MAVSEAAKLLDELMGRYRNLAPGQIDSKLTWESPEVRIKCPAQYALLSTNYILFAVQTILQCIKNYIITW